MAAKPRGGKSRAVKRNERSKGNKGPKKGKG